VVEEKLAQKKEEPEKEIRKNNLKIFNESNKSNKKIEFMDIFYSIYSNKSLLNNFSKLAIPRQYIF
jgi:hypothetical protein